MGIPLTITTIWGDQPAVNGRFNRWKATSKHGKSSPTHVAYLWPIQDPTSIFSFHSQCHFIMPPITPKTKKQQYWSPLYPIKSIRTHTTNIISYYKNYFITCTTSTSLHHLYNIYIYIYISFRYSPWFFFFAPTARPVVSILTSGMFFNNWSTSLVFGTKVSHRLRPTKTSPPTFNLPPPLTHLRTSRVVGHLARMDGENVKKGGGGYDDVNDDHISVIYLKEILDGFLMIFVWHVSWKPSFKG